MCTPFYTLIESLLQNPLKEPYSSPDRFRAPVFGECFQVLCDQGLFRATSALQILSGRTHERLGI